MRSVLLTFLALQSTVGGNGHVSDSLLAVAEQALSNGQPWKASRAVAPLLESPTTRTPPTILLAARAAAGWDGWEAVTRLLMGQDWLDSISEGDGRALLARAMVELKEYGFRIIGLDSEAETAIEAVDASPPLAVVLGAEGKGLRQLTRETCDQVARLAMPGAIKSLNVSNAAAVVLYALTHPKTV